MLYDGKLSSRLQHPLKLSEDLFLIVRIFQNVMTYNDIEMITRNSLKMFHSFCDKSVIILRNTQGIHLLIRFKCSHIVVQCVVICRNAKACSEIEYL